MTSGNGRFGRFMRASVQSLFTPAEDPRTAFAEPGRQGWTLLEQVRAAAARLAATRTRLEAQRELAERKVAALEDRARQALLAGREDVARLALQRQRIAAAEAEQLDAQIVALGREEAALAVAEQRLSAQIEAMRAREQLATARHTAARAQVAAGEALTGLGEALGDQAPIARLEADAEALQARADAIDELLAAGTLGGTSAPARSDAGPSTASEADIEERLRALKAELVG